MNASIQKVTKLDAARRQLRTAIQLWFNDGDAVSIHALAHASYEIIHVISRARKRKTKLIWDASFIKEEDRSTFNISTKAHANFFKHADKDPDATIDFSATIAEVFLTFSLMGLMSMDEPLDAIESAFAMWLLVSNRPSALTAAGRKFLDNLVPVEKIEILSRFSKRKFFDKFVDMRRRSAGVRK